MSTNVFTKGEKSRSQQSSANLNESKEKCSSTNFSRNWYPKIGTWLLNISQIQLRNLNPYLKMRGWEKKKETNFTSKKTKTLLLPALSCQRSTTRGLVPSRVQHTTRTKPMIKISYLKCKGHTQEQCHQSLIFQLNSCCTKPTKSHLSR